MATLEGRALLVVDALNFRICRFSPEGALESCFGEPGDGGGAFGRPKAVTADERGHIWVSDAQYDVVIGFDRAGAFRFAIGGAGAGEGRLSLPAGIAAGKDRLFVADSHHQRIQVYELIGGTP